MKKGVIYKATNIINGKAYVGQTINFICRKSHHRRLKGHCWLFYRAIQKYGFNNFKWEIIEENINEDLLDEKEVFYIDKFNTFKNGYNLTHGGSRTFGASGEHHYLNLMSDEEKEEWLKNYRLGGNNPNFGNGQSIAGANHFLNKMDDEERERWLNENIRGDNNYQKGMSKEELSGKCWINHLTEDEKDTWKKNHLLGDNNPFRKAWLKNPEKYRGNNSPCFGKVGRQSPQSKKYVIVFPNGDEYVVIGLKEFCRISNLGLKSPGLCQCANNKVDNYKGFKCRHYSNEDSDIKQWENFNEGKNGICQ